MNTKYSRLRSWLRRTTGLTAAVVMMLSLAGQASARILFEDDTYFNVLSEGIILDFNDNVEPGTASSLTDQTIVYTADNTGTAGDAISITLVETAPADLGGDLATITVTAVGDAITVTFQDDTNANPESVGQIDIVECINSAVGGANFTTGNGAAPGNGISCTITNDVTALITATGGTATTDAVALGATSLAGGVNGGNIDFQFGNDSTDALIRYNESTQDLTLSTPGGDFSFSDDNLTTTGGVLMQGSNQFHIREDSDPNANATCTALDEVIIDTTDNELQICTVVGSPGTWVSISSSDADTLDGLDSTQFLRSDTSDSYTSGTLTFNAGTILDVNGGIDFSGATSFLLYQGAANPGTCTEGEMFYNTTDNTTYICTATNTWTGLSSGNPDFEAVYAADGDSTLTASGTFDIDAVGALGIDSDAAVTIGGAGIGLTSDTGGDITLTSADDIIFDDAQLTGIVQLTDGVGTTDWAATLATDGIVDNINSFTLTTNGNGASNVGIEDASAWFTGTEIEAALNEIEALFGSTTSSTFNFTEDNVLADNDPVYTALNKLDLKWGDLASVANGEGASLIGVEDAGTYFGSTTVEGVLQELGASASIRVEDLTFYPEYPDTVVYADGTTNKGTLNSFYDATEVSGYYNWTTNNAITQDIDIRFDFPLPPDFDATGDFTFRYRTGTVTEADNDVEVRLYNVTDATECANDLTNGTAGVWATTTITAASINTNCTVGTALNAGDIVEVRIKLLDNSGAADYADIGRVVWNYTK